MKVVCQNAGCFRNCGGCPHSEPHKPNNDTIEGERCTSPGLCYGENSMEFVNIKVMCVEIYTPEGE